MNRKAKFARIRNLYMTCRGETNELSCSNITINIFMLFYRKTAKITNSELTHCIHVHVHVAAKVAVYGDDYFNLVALD